MTNASNLITIQEEALSAISHADTSEALEEIRIRYFGRKGILQELYKELPKLSPDQKPIFGQEVNKLKNAIQSKLDKQKELVKSNGAAEECQFDVTLPGCHNKLGKRHPITQTVDDICNIFLRLGFRIVEGPEIESEYHNFEALNIPLDHPSRDSFDTFYVEGKSLLRSQTSTVQIRVMESEKPPLQIIAPGKVYRPDAVDASHSFMFHQIEGLYVDRDIKFSDLKGTLYAFCQEFFGKDIKMRFRPHFFPFTEPSVEVDISWHKGWLEILGAGMVNPHVFKAVGIDPKKYKGFAFGLGVERLAMLKYGINDIRYFCENDLSFLKQF